MSEITLNSCLRDVEQIPALQDLQGQFLVQPSPMAQRFTGMPFSGMRAPGQECRVDAMVRGLQHLLACAETGRKIRWPVWPPEAVAQQPDRAQAQLLHLPGKPGAPFVVVCAGGGYQCIVTYTEGLTAAAELNAAGYHAFVLNYRVRQKQLMPKPIDDLAQAVRLVLNHADELGVDRRYAVMGFSAGGHLAAEWGTVNCGYRHYALPAPEALVLCYPAIDLRTLHGNQTADEFYASMQDQNGSVDDYCVNLHMDASYPPTYVWQCEDDDVVDFANYRILCEALERYGIPHKARSYSRGGHGLSNPHDPEADRWMSDVLAYLDEKLPVTR